ncbi:membrane protein insertion efficiency factor YidD [Candidatus Dojkabacteria bacterium]|nr:membrane protein insertion efficiency factor YidD [Candidatus Dojkabacteria bacterium]
MRYILMFLIRIYQKTLSFDHGLMGRVFPGIKSCIFTPTCSEYGYQAIERYGAIRGSWMAVQRIVRCGPWSAPGYDPVPQRDR